MQDIKALFLFFLFLPFSSYAQKIVWDQHSLKQISPADDGVRYSGYARMIELHDGSWLCVYESAGNIVCTKSVDHGNSWSQLISIAKKERGMNMCVPSLLQLQDSSLLAMYNPRPTEDGTPNRFAIKIKKSYDNGLTWKDEQLLYEAGNRFKDGCWEPAAIQLPDGEVQLFFANEGIYSNSDEQNISLLRSLDKGLTWTKEPQVVSFRMNSRDGMPVPLLLQDNKHIVIAIEDNGKVNFKPYIIHGSVEKNWSQPVFLDSEERVYALKRPLDDSIYAGAPYLCQLKSGETLLSYQGTEGRENSMDFAEMKVLIGDVKARNFDSKSVPFQIPPRKFALWNSLMIASDGTIVALTSTNAYSNGRVEVWMIKGQFVRN